MKPVRNAFDSTFQQALKLSNRAAGRTDPKSLRDQKKAARLFLGLTRRLKGRSPLERWNVRRHYYRSSGQYLRVVALGKAEIARGNKSGVLSVGFGHLDYAGELMEKKRYRSAITHAGKAERAFRKILRLEGPKSNRCLALAFSLAIQGKLAEAEGAVADAQRCGCKPAEVRQYRQQVKKLSRDRQAGS